MLSGSRDRQLALHPASTSTCTCTGTSTRNRYTRRVNANVAKCLVVSKVLVADGMMSDEEKTFLSEMMTTLGLSDAEKRSVHDLEGIDQATALVRGLPVEERQSIVEQLVDAASADGKLSPLELDVVKRVTKALGL